MPSLRVLLTERQIQSRVRELAQQIKADYQGKQLLLLAVLKGSFIFLADFCRHLDQNVEIEFVQLSSYAGGTESSGIVQIRKDLDVSIEGRDVLIVEDILDTGLTMAHLRELLGTRHPRSLKVITLLAKPAAMRRGAQAEYVGFEIPDQFVVGYGLDQAERHRNLPYVAVLDQ